MKVSWKGNFPSRGVAAKIAYKELESVRGKDGNITPEAIIKRAKSARSPIHPIFEWDDGKAAAQYRLRQARNMIGCIEVVRTVGPKVPMRAYEVRNARPAESKKPRRVYDSVEQVLADPAAKADLLAQAIRDAAYFRKRYHALQELSQVIAAFDGFLMAHDG